MAAPKLVRSQLSINPTRGKIIIFNKESFVNIYTVKRVHTQIDLFECLHINDTDPPIKTIDIESTRCRVTGTIEVIEGTLHRKGFGSRHVESTNLETVKVSSFYLRGTKLNAKGILFPNRNKGHGFDNLKGKDTRHTNIGNGQKDYRQQKE